MMEEIIIMGIFQDLHSMGLHFDGFGMELNTPIINLLVFYDIYTFNSFKMVYISGDYFLNPIC